VVFKAITTLSKHTGKLLVGQSLTYYFHSRKTIACFQVGNVTLYWGSACKYCTFLSDFTVAPFLISNLPFSELIPLFFWSQQVGYVIIACL